jgi:hypothetical protein
MNQRLIHDAAFILARELASRLNLAREEQVEEAVEEFYLICRAALEGYEIQANRMQQRLRPCSN